MKTCFAALFLCCLPALGQTPEIAAESDYEPPAPILLTHGSRQYYSAIGTSCWAYGNGGTFCDDVFAIVTPSVPIVVRRGDRVTFEIPLRDKLESMTYSITHVTDGDIRKNEGDQEFPQFRYWQKQTREREMTEAQLGSIVINKPPGDYVLVMYGEWKDYGDAVHGFYLKVVN